MTHYISYRHLHGLIKNLGLAVSSEDSQVSSGVLVFLNSLEQGLEVTSPEALKNSKPKHSYNDSLGKMND